MGRRLLCLLVLTAAWLTGVGPGTPTALAASPAKCAPGDPVETGLQGQVPIADRVSGRAEKGYACNLTEVGAFASTSFANFDTYKNCAYYSDTIGLYSADGGTIVLDVSDPRTPVKTDYLQAKPFRNAGESLRVNAKRGLLVADRYVFRDVARSDDPTSQRQLAVYDVKGDCRKPKLLADTVMPSAQGHEGCFQPDGFVYYMADTRKVTPIDLTDPANPKQLSDPEPFGVHGCSTNADGTRGYFADIGLGRVLIADTSQVAQRRKGARITPLGEITLPDAEGQQGTIPLSYGGKPFLLDFSEYRTIGAPCTPGAPGTSNFGYGAILDIADERKPKLVSRMQTEVMLPKNCAAIQADRAFLTTNGLNKGDIFAAVGSQVFLYDTHYCSTDRQLEPTIAACSSFASGVRVYDIRDPAKPVEIAYWNPGPVSGSGGSVGNAAIARPVVRSDLGQIWFPDTNKGFHVLQFRDGVWPFKGQDPCPGEDAYLAQYDLGHEDCRAQRRQPVQLPGTKTCRSRRDFSIRLQPRVRSARVFVNGKLKATVRGRRARVDLRGLPRGRYTVRVVARLADGRTITRTRRYRTCVPRARSRAAMEVGGRSVSSISATRVTPEMNEQLRQVLLLCRLAARA